MATTPRKGGKAGKAGTPRATSAPPKERPNLQAAIGKVKVGASISKVIAGSAAPQSRGDPNNIKVGVRCRPLSKTEKGLNESEIVQFSGTSICLTNPAPAAGEPADNVFAYDYVYQQDSDSATVFADMAQPLCEGLFDGFNGTLFAYGQTGSGKTWSMMGNAEFPGVIPRCATDIFERVAVMLEELGEGGGRRRWAASTRCLRLRRVVAVRLPCNR